MASRTFLSSAQTQAAMNAMMAKANETPDQGVAITIVDDSGNLLAYAQMDNLRMFARRHSFRKAYTCAMMGADSGAHGLARAHAGHPGILGLWPQLTDFPALALDGSQPVPGLVAQVVNHSSPTARRIS